MSKSIWLIRHAENSKEEKDGLALTDTGIKQAHDLAARMTALEPNSPILILTTPMLRGSSTGKIIRDAFAKAARTVNHLESPHFLGIDDEETMRIMSFIGDLEFHCAKLNIPVPESVVLVGHKRGMLLEIMGCALDPEGYMNPGIDEQNRLSSDELTALAYTGAEGINALFPHGDVEAPLMNYLEAMQYRFLPESWDGLAVNTGRLQTHLRIE